MEDEMAQKPVQPTGEKIGFFSNISFVSFHTPKKRPPAPKPNPVERIPVPRQSTYRKGSPSSWHYFVLILILIGVLIVLVCAFVSIYDLRLVFFIIGGCMIISPCFYCCCRVIWCTDNYVLVEQGSLGGTEPLAEASTDEQRCQGNNAPSSESLPQAGASPKIELPPDEPPPL